MRETDMVHVWVMDVISEGGIISKVPLSFFLSNPKVVISILKEEGL